MGEIYGFELVEAGFTEALVAYVTDDAGDGAADGVLSSFGPLDAL